MPVPRYVVDRPTTGSSKIAVDLGRRPGLVLVTRSAAAAPACARSAAGGASIAEAPASARTQITIVAAERARQEDPLRLHDEAHHPAARRRADQRRDHPGGRAEHAELDQPRRPDLPPRRAQALQDHRLLSAPRAARRRPRRPAPARPPRASATRSPASAAAILSSKPATASSTSATRMPGHVRQRVGHGTQQGRPARAGAARTVAICVCGACSSRPGLATMTKLSDERAPVDVAQAGDLEVDVAAEHVDPDGVAEPTPQPSRHAGIERDERRPSVIRRPPAPGDDPRAFRRRRGVGQAAVAAQRPSRFRGGLHLIGRARRSRATMRARRLGTSLQIRSPPAGLERALRTRAAGRSGCRRRRRSARSAGICSGTSAAHVALDQRDRGESGEAEPDRDQHQRRRRARPVQIGHARAGPRVR